MKIFFIIDETLIMLPDWFNQVINNLPKDIKVVGVTPAGHKNKQPTIFTYLYKNFLQLGAWSLIKLGFYLSHQCLKYLLFRLGLSHSPATITQVAQKYHLKIINSNNVNSPNYLTRLRKVKPEVIVSSGSQIFKKDLLSLPKTTCINRHSAALPAYGGLFPIFRAMINREKKIGVTIHHMVEKVDKGKVIYQELFSVKKDDTLFSLYQKSYDISVRAIIKALEIIQYHNKPIVIKNLKPSYYSFPTNKDWRTFFNKGNKFI